MQAAGIPPAEKEGGENTTVHLGSFFKDGGEAEIKQTRHRGRTHRLTLGFRVSFLRIAFCPTPLSSSAPRRWLLGRRIDGGGERLFQWRMLRSQSGKISPSIKVLLTAGEGLSWWER